MKKILIVWTIIVLVLVGGLTFIGMNLKNKNRVYYELEDKLTEAAKDYYSQYPYELPAADAIISAERLITVNFLNELKYEDETCNGYVVIKKKYISHNYVPYIKCSNYQTKNYNIKNEGANL